MDYIVLFLIFILIIAVLFYIFRTRTPTPNNIIGGAPGAVDSLPRMTHKTTNMYVRCNKQLANFHFKILGIDFTTEKTYLDVFDKSDVENNATINRALECDKDRLGMKITRALAAGGVNTGSDMPSKANLCVLPYFPHNFPFSVRSISDLNLEDTLLMISNEPLIFCKHMSTKLGKKYIYGKFALPSDVHPIIERIQQVYTKFGNDIQKIINKWFDTHNGIIKTVVDATIIINSNFTKAETSTYFIFDEKINCNADNVMDLLNNRYASIKLIYTIVALSKKTIEYDGFLLLINTLNYSKVYEKLFEYLYVVYMIHEAIDNIIVADHTRYNTNITYLGAMCCMAEIFSYDYSINVRVDSLDGYITKFKSHIYDLDQYDRLNYVDLLSLLSTKKSCISKLSENARQANIKQYKETKIKGMIDLMLSNTYTIDVKGKIKAYTTYVMPDEHVNLYKLIDIAIALCDSKIQKKQGVNIPMEPDLSIYTDYITIKIDEIMRNVIQPRIVNNNLIIPKSCITNIFAFEYVITCIQKMPLDSGFFTVA